MFELAFLPAALKEWHGLDKAIQIQFSKKLGKLLAKPRIISMKLRDHADCYRIKARKAGYRLIYHVGEEQITVTVIKVARRDKDEAYENLIDRLSLIDPQ